MMKWTEANGVCLRYELRGAGDGPLLVLLHEMGGCLESWDTVLDHLPDGCRTLRFDMRGAGMSEKLRGPFSLDGLVEDLRALLDGLGLAAPVALAGCAVGALVALCFAARHPERAARVMAMAPATGIAPRRQAETLELADQVTEQGLRPRLLTRFDHSYPPRYFDDPDLRRQVWGRLLSHDPFCYAQTYRMLCRVDADADLRAVRCPVLLVAGRHDGTRPPAVVESLTQVIAGARFLEIDSGHVMPVLSPARVAQAIRQFLLEEPATAP